MKKTMTIMLSMMLIYMMVACQQTQEETPMTHYSIASVVTRGDRLALFERQDDFQTTDDSRTLANTVSIDTTELFQTMDGFGAAMTESSAYLIASLQEEQRQALLIDLFSKTDGIGIDFIRIPIGSSDFSFDNFSYNDMPNGQTDEDLIHFTLERDEAYIIPVLKEIMAINPNIKLIGSPWSAPAWMKSNQSMNGGTLLPEYYDVYARYFLKFIQGYEAHGLNIYAVTPQNEPLHQTTNYPTMYMTAQEQVQFISHLGPTLRNAGYETLIIAYDHNWDEPSYPNAVLGNPLVRDYVAGAAFHCYAGNVSAQDTVHRLNPNKGIWFTECSGGGWTTNFSNNIQWNMQHVFIGSINYHSKSVLLWNLALDDQHGPTNGGCMNCRGVITIHDDGTYTRNEEYYSIAHFSKHVVPGAIRVKVDSSNTQLLATGFLNPDGSIVLVMHNMNRSHTSFNININGTLTEYRMPQHSTATLIINKI